MYQPDTKLDLDNLKTMGLPGVDAPTYGMAANSIVSFQRDADMARNGAEKEWLECAANVLGSPDAYNWLRNHNARREIIEKDWRHKTHSGKAYELVETIHAYLMGAMFPNNQWVGLSPTRQAIPRANLQILESFFRQILDRAEFQEATDEFIRQLLMIGNSVMSMPWDDENNLPIFKTLDIFDFYLDPFALDINKANVCRVLRKTRAEIWDRVQKGEYVGIEKADIIQLSSTITDKRINRDRINSWQGMNLKPGTSMKDYVEILDYWGDLQLDGVMIYDVHAVVISGKLVKIESSRYGGLGKPFIFCGYKKMPISIYAQGVLNPALGQLATQDILNNQTLDNLELAINKKWGYVEDGVTDPDEMVNIPGARIKMAEPNNVWEIPTQGLESLQYVHIDRMLNDIDKAVGVGPLISAGPGRSGERVTAAEISATRDAGGNRLSAVHRHIERTFFLPAMRRTWNSLRKFFKGEGVAKITVTDHPDPVYVRVPRSDLQIGMDFIVKGADYVVNREREIEDLTLFINVVSGIQPMAEMVNWPELTRRFAEAVGIFDDVNEIVMQPETGPSPQEQAMLAQAQQAEQAALQAQQAPLPISANGVPLPGVAEYFQENSPAAFPPEALNSLLTTEGVEGLANLTVPPSRQAPVQR